MKNRTFGTIAVAGLLMGSTSAFGALIAEHVGSADPATESGWTASGTVADNGAVSDGGVDAWSIGSGGYQFNTTDPSLASGWMLSVNVRTADATMDGGVHTQFRMGATTYSMWFGTDGVDPSVGVISALTNPLGFNTHTVAGGAGEYNLYELLDQDGTAGAGTATLYVNGVEAITGITGVGAAGNFVLFGDGTNGAGTGDFALVRLEGGAGLTPTEVIVPEPASMALLAVGSYFLLPRRKRA